MEPKTKDILKQTITKNTKFMKEVEDDLENIKRRKKQIEDEARERRRKITF